MKYFFSFTWTFWLRNYYWCSCWRWRTTRFCGGLLDASCCWRATGDAVTVLWHGYLEITLVPQPTVRFPWDHCFQLLHLHRALTWRSHNCSTRKCLYHFVGLAHWSTSTWSFDHSSGWLVACRSQDCDAAFWTANSSYVDETKSRLRRCSPL